MARKLADRYNEALDEVDVLVMSTPPQIAHEFVDDLFRPEFIERALNINNSCPFDMTGS